MAGTRGPWWLVAEPALGGGEHLLLRLPANRSQGRLARGGALFLTNERLLFKPHRFDRAMGGKCCELRIDEICDVDVLPATGGWFDGGLRERLQVRTRSGRTELLVVSGLPRIVDAVQAQLG